MVKHAWLAGAGRALIMHHRKRWPLMHDGRTGVRACCWFWCHQMAESGLLLLLSSAFELGRWMGGHQWTASHYGPAAWHIDTTVSCGLGFMSGSLNPRPRAYYLFLSFCGALIVLKNSCMSMRLIEAGQEGWHLGRVGEGWGLAGN